VDVLPITGSSYFATLINSFRERIIVICTISVQVLQALQDTPSVRAFFPVQDIDGEGAKFQINSVQGLENIRLE
jgi:hypothetical protein